MDRDGRRGRRFRGRSPLRTSSRPVRSARPTSHQVAPPVTGHCAGADSARFCRASPWSRQAPPLPVSARTAHPRCRVSTRPAGIALAVLCSWCVPSLEVGKAPTALLDDIHGRRPGFLREYFQDGDREVPHVVAPCRPPPASLPVPPLSPRARTI